jgi:hypothetical protein
MFVSGSCFARNSSSQLREKSDGMLSSVGDGTDHLVALQDRRRSQKGLALPAAYILSAVRGSGRLSIE